MNFENKVPIAVEAHSKLDLPCDHASTGMFMLLQPMFYRHTLKTERLDLSFTSTIRPNPLVVPTFGRVRHNLRHFFVPYRLVFLIGKNSFLMLLQVIMIPLHKLLVFLILLQKL